MAEIIEISKDSIKGSIIIDGCRHLVIDDHYFDTLTSFGFKKIYRYPKSYANIWLLRTNHISNNFVRESNASIPKSPMGLFLNQHMYYIKSNASDDRLTYMKLALS